MTDSFYTARFARPTANDRPSETVNEYVETKKPLKAAFFS
ncbi:Unknown protein sequence [Pseudomonas coronafaciens pv. oryzae]|nr:Unknown protein sequence [Pseudomonas coronafaciens pv. oryzae]